MSHHFMNRDLSNSSTFNQTEHFHHYHHHHEEIQEARATITALLVLMFILIGVSFITTATRCYSRIRYSRVFTSEDWLAIFAWIFALVLSLLACWQMRHGIGNHINTRRSESAAISGTHLKAAFIDVNGTQPEEIQKAFEKPSWKQQTLLLSGPVLSPMVHITGVTLIKLSLLIFYRRLVPSNRFRAICMATVVFVVMSWVALMGALLFQCKPFWALWTLRRLTTATCINSENIYMAIAVLSFVADVVIFFLPIPVVLRSGLPKGQKMHVLGVFFLGIIIILASAIRVFFIARTLDKVHLDINRRIAFSIFTAVLELDLAVIVACLPACKMFMAKTFNVFVMPTTPQYIWTPEVTACKRAEIRLRDLEEGNTDTVLTTSDSQTQLQAAPMAIVEHDVVSNRTIESRGTVDPAVVQGGS